MAADADLCLILAFNTRSRHFKYFLNSISRFGTEADARMICLSLLGVLKTKDGSSLSSVRNRVFIAFIGLNLAGTGGVGKKAQNTRLKSRVTKFFVTSVAGGLGEVVHAV